MLALAAACGGAAPDGERQLAATVVRRAGSRADTIRFAVPAVARRCADERALLLEGVDHLGNGVLVLLRGAEAPAPGTYPVTVPGDSTTRPAAQVAVRYMLREVAYGFALERGSVALTAAGSSFAARVTGAGVESAFQDTITAEYAGVPVDADTVPCGYQP